MFPKSTQSPEETYMEDQIALKRRNWGKQYSSQKKEGHLRGKCWSWHGHVYEWYRRRPGA